MPQKAAQQPISRDLARIIRDSSLLGCTDAPLSKHLQAVEDRRAQGLEFYLRACALRLEEGCVCAQAGTAAGSSSS